METKELAAISIAVGFGLLICLSLFLYHKLSSAIARLKKDVIRHADNTIAQVDALLAIYCDIRPDHGFPPTRGWAASPDFLRHLSQFISTKSPKTIVECGSGVSTLILAACLKKQGKGKLYSLDHNSEFAEKTRQLLNQHDLSDWATVVHAPLKKIEFDAWNGKWYDTSSIPSDLNIDMLVVDGPPENVAKFARYPAVPVFQRQFNTGCIILVDDADREDEQETIDRWKKYNRCLVSIPYLSAEKGIHGFILHDSE